MKWRCIRTVSISELSVESVLNGNLAMPRSASLLVDKGRTRAFLGSWSTPATPKMKAGWKSQGLVPSRCGLNSGSSLNLLVSVFDGVFVLTHRW